METQRQKEIGVLVVTIIVTIVSGLIIRAATINLDSLLGLSWGAAIVILLWAAIVGSALLLLHQWQSGRVILAVSGFLIIAGLGMFSSAGFIGGVLLGLFIYAAGELVARKTEERIRLQLRFVVLPALNLLIAGSAVAVFSLSVPTLRDATESGRFGISEDVTRTILDPASPLLSGFLPGYTSRATIDELLIASAHKQGIAVGETISSEDLAVAREQLNQSFDLSLRGDETLPGAVALYLNDFFRRVTAGNSIIAIIGLAAAALLAVRAAVPIISWVPLFVASGILWLCRKASLVTITEVPVQAQRITY